MDLLDPAFFLLPETAARPTALWPFSLNHRLNPQLFHVTQQNLQDLCSLKLSCIQHAISHSSVTKIDIVVGNQIDNFFLFLLKWAHDGSILFQLTSKMRRNFELASYHLNGVTFARRDFLILAYH